MPGDADYYLDADHNFICDLCGKKEKAINGVKTWDNFYVCRLHKEERNPQDYLRGVKDDQTVPWSRPRPSDKFVTVDHRLLQQNGGAILQENGSNILVT